MLLLILHANISDSAQKTSIFTCEHFPNVFLGRLKAVRPLNQPNVILLAEPSLLDIKLLPLSQRFLPAEEINRAVMLNALILNCRSKRRHIEIKALPSEPFRAILI